MNKISVYLLVLIVPLVFFGCEEDELPCKTCGYDNTPHEIEFSIDGILKADCFGTPAINRLLEFHIFHREDTLIGTSLTDSNGHFAITYKKVISQYDLNTSQWSSELKIIDKEDSTIFFMPGLRNLPGLDLTLNDSFDVDIIVKKGVQELTSGDIILYWFGTNKPLIIAEAFNKYGPFTENEVIHHLSKWRYITYEEHSDSPSLNLYWAIQLSSSSYLENSNWRAEIHKIPCEAKVDSLIIYLP